MEDSTLASPALGDWDRHGTLELTEAERVTNPSQFKSQMGIRLAAAMGNEVTAISTNPSKKEMALKTGAKHFIVSKVSCPSHWEQVLTSESGLVLCFMAELEGVGC